MDATNSTIRLTDEARQRLREEARRLKPTALTELTRLREARRLKACGSDGAG